MKTGLYGIILYVIAAAPAGAIDCRAFSNNTDIQITEDEAAKLSDIARDAYIEYIEKGEFNTKEFESTPVSVEYVPDPVLPMEITRRTMDQALFSTYAKACNISSETQYMNFMKRQKEKRKWTSEEMVFLSFFRGFMLGVYEEAMPECNRETIKLVHQYNSQCESKINKPLN